MSRKEISLKNFVETKTCEQYTSFLISDYGVCGSIDRNGEHYIWDKNGNISIYDWKKELPISYEKLVEFINAVNNGKYICCKCHKILEKNEGHRYFVGTYCDECWNNNTVLQDNYHWDYSHLD